MSIEGEEVTIQNAQKVNWMREQIGTVHLGAPEITNGFILPGTITLKARATVIVLTNTVNTTADVVFCRMQGA